jgi:hypothetical protein
MLPPALRTTIEETALREGAEETLEALAALDATLDALVAAYDEAVALAPKLRECPVEVADPPKPPVSPPWLIEEAHQRAFRARFEERVRGIASEAYVVRWGDLRYLARLQVAGAPLVATAAGNFDTAATTTTTEFTSTLRTSVHPSAPAVSVKGMGRLGGVAKALRLARDDETGDPEFDASFLVDGPNGGVLLLSRDVTAALRELSAWNVGLVVKHGIAEVTWSATFRGNGFELVHDAAFGVVLGIRATIERA